MEKNNPIVYVSFADLRQMKFDIEVSEYDKELSDGRTVTSVKIEKIKKDGIEIPRKEMLELLFILGMNTSKGGRWWVDIPKAHRPMLSNKPVVDYRFVGEERLDKDWIQSGRASHEALMYSSRMRDMIRVANRMENGGDV